MFAVIEFNKKQYKAVPDKVIDLPNFEYDEKEKKIIFDKVLLISNEDKTEIGQPEIAGAKVEGEIISKARTDKVRVFKFRAKKRYKRTKGQRQTIVKVKINKINLK